MKNSPIKLLIILLIFTYCGGESKILLKKHINPGFFYNSEELFGRNIDKKFIIRSRKIIENTQRISKNKLKNKFLYSLLETQIKKKYKPKTVARLFGFIDEEREGVLLAVFLQANYRVRRRLSPHYVLPNSFLFSALNNEGWVFADYSNYRTLHNMTGFGNLGLDWFGSECKYIIDEGFLYGEFKDKFSITTNTNEIGQMVISAHFDNVDTSFEAFAATMAYRQKALIRDLKNQGIEFETLPREQKLFWTYYYFNGGPGNGAMAIKQFNTLKKLSGFFHKRTQKGPKGNALIVISTMHWLEKSGVFNYWPEEKFWWSRKVPTKK